ncbi:MarR family transcriptional regulator [Escherichia coli]|nr:MarR family transcriptional regulator [Escherichia coli]
MTGKEAIIHYLGTHNSFCAPDVAALTGATVTSINQAAAKMARAGLLVIEGKCHERCNSDPHPTPEIRSRG